jgi:hypothetical protein
MGPFAAHRFLTRGALSAVNVFSWLFIFQYFFIAAGGVVAALVATACSYAFAQTVAILLTPYTARRLRHGIRGMLVNALIALAGAYAILALGFSGILGSIPLAIVLFAASMGLYRALYWIPYELAAKKHSRSRITDIALACIPAISGYVMTLSASAPLIVLSCASLVALCAIVPVYLFRNTHEGFSWSYRGTFRHLFTYSHRRPLIQAICNGFEGAALLLLWPIVVLVMLEWSYAALGLVLSVTYLCTIFARAVLAHYHHHAEKRLVLSALTITGWMLRGTVAAPLSIVLVDTYYQSGSGISQRGVDLLTSEQSADSNSYVDEFTALKDMGQGIGRIVFCLMIVLLSNMFSFPVLALTLFGITALVAVYSIAVSRTATKHSF